LDSTEAKLRQASCSALRAFGFLFMTV
jgi:hypothetical protein